ALLRWARHPHVARRLVPAAVLRVPVTPLAASRSLASLCAKPQTAISAQNRVAPPLKSRVPSIYCTRPRFHQKEETTMLPVWGPRQRFCDGISRRNFLKIGALGAGMSLAEMLRLRASASGKTSPKAAIMIYLPGGPSHMDMYDLKPDAPKEFRGEFNPIKTNVTGVQICEHFPLQAR